LWSPIVITNRTLPDHFAGALTVENRYSFTDVNQCRFSWELWRFAAPGEAATGHTVLAAHQLASPSIPPGGTGDLELDLPSNAQAADALALRAMDRSGHELWTWVWPLPGINHFRKSIELPTEKKVLVRETEQNIEIKAGDLTVLLSRKTGMLAGVQRGPQNVSLLNGPLPVVGSAKLIQLETKTNSSDCVVNARFAGGLESVSWRVRGNGWVQCDYQYTATGTQNLCGVLFDYPEKFVKSKKWLGDGPYRVWKNRLRGTTLDLWKNDFNNTITGWKDWNYPEFKGCFANVRWLQVDTTEGPVTAVPGKEMFVQVLTPEFPPVELQKDAFVFLPRTGLAFLDAIPPIGSKFHRAGASGPQGRQTEAVGTYSGSINFFFGEAPAMKE